MSLHLLSRVWALFVNSFIPMSGQNSTFTSHGLHARGVLMPSRPFYMNRRVIEGLKPAGIKPAVRFIMLLGSERIGTTCVPIGKLRPVRRISCLFVITGQVRICGVAGNRAGK